MSALRKALPAALMRGLIALLLAAGIGMPLLDALGMGFLLGRYLLICLAVCAFCSLLNLKKRALGLSLLAILLLEGALLLARRGYFAHTLHLSQAVLLYLRGEELALTLYGDVLCLHLAVALSLFAYFAAAPDTGASLFLSVCCVALGTEWALGLRTELRWMVPLLPAVLLACGASHASESEAPRPALSLLPLAAALLGVSLLLAPPEGMTNPTLSRFAQDLRERVRDRFFFQQERARYTLAADGWMPLGEHRLGGVPEPDERAVLRVQAKESVYLRGAILDTYNGAAWYDTLSARRYYWGSLRHRALREEITQSAYPLQEQLPEHQLSVQLLSPGPSTLFLPQRLRSLTVGDRMTPYFNLSGEVFITRNLTPEDAYSAACLPMKATDSGMAALAARHEADEDPGYPANTAYTALPGHIQQEVYDIAYSVTANCTTPWEKAVALRDYLKTTCAYTLNVQEPPVDVDFVAWFLLAEREGYCTYFATAMTVLSRMAGLPARYVEGYLALPDANGEAIVRGVNAHAWTEIYLNGVGWVTFDATPGHGDADDSGSAPPPPAEDMPSSAPNQTPTPPPRAEQTPTPAPPQASEPPEDQPSNAPETPTPTPPAEGDSPPAPSDQPPEADPPAGKDPGRERPLPWLWLLLLLALLCLLAWRIRAADPLARALRAKDGSAALLLLWRAILEEAAALQLPIADGETPLSYAQRAEARLGVHLREPAVAVSALRYGRHAPARSALAQARTAYTALHERLSPGRKLLLALMRAVALKPRRKKA